MRHNFQLQLLNVFLSSAEQVILTRHRRTFRHRARNLRGMPALVNHDGTPEGDDDRTVLIVAPGLQRHNANVWS